MNQDYEFNPKLATPSVVAGYNVPGNLYKLGKACDKWLERRYALEGRRPAIWQWKKSTGNKPRVAVPDAAENKAQRKIKALADKIRRHAQKKAKTKASNPKKPKAAKIKVPREPKEPKPRKKYSYPYKYRSRNRSKYQTEEERSAAKSRAAKERWQNMTPEQRAAHIAGMAAKRKREKNAIPRHLRPGWAEYRREWQRKKRETTVLTPEQIEERRRKSRELYARQDPEKKRQQNAERRARHKAKKAALRAAASLNTKLAA